MEVAGLATAEAIATLWSDVNNFGGDAKRFCLRFSMQKTRLHAFEKVLFEANKFPLVQRKIEKQESRVLVDWDINSVASSGNAVTPASTLRLAEKGQPR